MSSFTEYFIKRQHCLPDPDRDIEYLVMNEAAFRELALPGGIGKRIPFMDLRMFRNTPVVPSDGPGRPFFLVKLKGEDTVENWLEAWTEDPECTRYQHLIKNY